jgi:hypothetical protein
MARVIHREEFNLHAVWMQPCQESILFLHAIGFLMDGPVSKRGNLPKIKEHGDKEQTRADKEDKLLVA